MHGVDDTVGSKAAKIPAQLAPCRQQPHGLEIADGDRPDGAFAVAAVFVAIAQRDLLAFVNLRPRSRHVDAVGFPAPARAGAGNPTASTWRERGRRFTKARRSRCAIATNTAATANAPSGRSPSAISRPCGCWRHGASCAGIFAAFEPTVSSTPCIWTKNTPSGVTC